jgi:Catechol dioxygenase N terminus
VRRAAALPSFNAHSPLVNHLRPASSSTQCDLEEIDRHFQRHVDVVGEEVQGHVGQDSDDLVVRHADRQVADARLFQVYASAVRHLHDFVREVWLSEPELRAGRGFINAAVRATQAIPAGELHMLTDLLGVSELVEPMANAGRDGLIVALVAA